MCVVCAFVVMFGVCLFFCCGCFEVVCLLVECDLCLFFRLCAAYERDSARRSAEESDL
jgi:hypothetical protein